MDKSYRPFDIFLGEVRSPPLAPIYVKDGVYAGFVEISFRLPEKIPHFIME